MSRMEFLQSRAFRIYLTVTLSVAVLALLVTIVVALASSAHVPQRSRITSPQPQSVTGKKTQIAPESMLLPQSWKSPDTVELIPYHQSSGTWDDERIKPFWVAPGQVEQESLQKKSDEAVEQFLGTLP